MRYLVLTARHHACESMASHVLEGILSGVLADDDCGRRWREGWQVVAAPFMDKDGVEDGDQGKNRRPHDHNRDYGKIGNKVSIHHIHMHKVTSTLTYCLYILRQFSKICR